MLDIKSCPVCEKEKIKDYHQFGIAPSVRAEIMPGVHVNAGIISRYSQCENCHVIFQNPRMTDDELHQFYSQGYYRKFINLTDEEINIDEEKRAEVDTRIIKNYIRNIQSHLDVGGGRGYLLQKVGAEIKVEVEPQEAYSLYPEVKTYATLESVPPQKFDLVTAIHVLEHEPYPITYLQKMIAFLDKKSHLVIEVPTWKSSGGPLRLPHLFHFEPDVLRLMCMRLKLRIVATEFTPHLIIICKKEQS